MTGELLTVKEYAARQGMTEQAAYKQIRAGKLTTVERQENGKPKKYIFCPVDPEEAAASPAPDPRIEEPAEREQPPRPADQTAAALEKAVAALSAQIKEKDRQINRLAGSPGRAAAREPGRRASQRRGASARYRTAEKTRLLGVALWGVITAVPSAACPIWTPTEQEQLNQLNQTAKPV